MNVGAYLIRDLHIDANGRDVIRHIRGKFRDDKRSAYQYRAARHAVYRDALEAHAKHQQLAARFGL